MHFNRQPISTIRHQTWFETAATSPKSAGREHRDGVMRGLAFVAAMLGLFVLLTASGLASDTDHEIANVQPFATYTVAALDDR